MQIYKKNNIIKIILLMLIIKILIKVQKVVKN